MAVEKAAEAHSTLRHRKFLVINEICELLSSSSSTWPRSWAIR